MADTTFHLYAYNPSLAAALIFIVLFALTTLLHTYQLFRTRAWYLLPIVIGGCCKPSYAHASKQKTQVANQEACS